MILLLFDGAVTYIWIKELSGADTFFFSSTIIPTFFFIDNDNFSTFKYSTADGRETYVSYRKLLRSTWEKAFYFRFFSKFLTCIPFFNLFNVLSSILFDFKVLIDWLAFRLDFMWYISSHIDHRHRVTPHARSLCVINQTLKFSKFASSLASMMTLVMEASQSCVWSVLQ